jgi:predicted lipoprotein
MRNRLIFLSAATLTIVTCLLCLSSCDNGEESKQDNFDRSAMLQHYADDLIIPSYNVLLAQVNVLETAATTFTGNVSVDNLLTVQQAWKNAYRDWQYANAYNFGPAGEAGLKKTLVAEIGLFPVSETKVDNAISTSTYDLSDANRDARGFLAVEYLLFNLTDDNAAVVTAFENTTRKQLLLDLIANIKTQISTVSSEWSTYKSTFVANNGTAVGSGVSLLYNEFVSSYEALKNYKVAFPLGLMAGQTQASPADVEAYYSGESLEMLKLHVTALENIWYGKNREGIDGIGFKEYLEAVEGGPALITSIENQFAAIHAKLDPLDVSKRFSEEIEISTTPYVALNTELQKNVYYLKSEMSSLLGIAITFSSADGD